MKDTLPDWTFSKLPYCRELESCTESNVCFLFVYNEQTLLITMFLLFCMCFLIVICSTQLFIV